MKQAVKKRNPSSTLDYIALSVTTCGVGYIPGMPGTYGSLIGVGIYVLAANVFQSMRYGAELASPEHLVATLHAIILIALLLFCLLGVWSAGRSVELLGNSDAPQAVVDEVMGQLLVFLFIPFTTSWMLIGAAFLLFRLFDIWKPYPIHRLEALESGLGIMADDLLAGAYAATLMSLLTSAFLLL